MVAALTIPARRQVRLHFKAESLRWPVSGPHFRDYHLLLDEQSAQIPATTYATAKRVRKIGGTNCIRQRQTDGEWKTIAHDARILWTDALSVAPDGYPYFIASQLHRQPQVDQGKDLREKPYALFRVKVEAGRVPL